MPSATVAASAPSFKYPHFIWITLDWYPSKWWTSQVAGDDPAVNCTDEQFEQILNRSLVIAQYPQAENNSSPTDVRMVCKYSLLNIVPECSNRRPHGEKGMGSW